ncbi:LAMI_0H17370g1_1 [Lachancea mirantina]|uniref:LAMI_0H17370g1_1 n=1 Tax=Lachancea mirantina TaxID=1230905 RepID=A0A1G4KJC1_9SACH|nr:LAMI_0H17370g1_1 [Lachancea mirantina]
MRILRKYDVFKARSSPMSFRPGMGVRNIPSQRQFLSMKPDVETVTDSIEDPNNQEGLEKLKSTRGKKLKPSKSPIVVLNPREAGLFRKRKVSGHFRSHGRVREKLSALDGVYLERNKTGAGFSSSDLLKEIESQRRKLLVFKSPVAREQVIKSIHDLQPPDDKKMMSQKRYEQLFGILKSAYTLPQLKDFARCFFNTPANSTIPKKLLIPRILNDFWGCTVSERISENDDLIVERVIDVETRDMYLLLLTNNGKIMQNFARLGATVAVALNENKIIVRGSGSLVKYVEVSIRKILANVQREILPMNDIISNHTPRNESLKISVSKILELIQKECAVFFERLLEDDSNSYLATAFGARRVEKARKLILRALDYSPQKSNYTKLVTAENRKEYKLYPFADYQCLDWLNKNENWFRLQKPVFKGAELEKTFPGPSLLNEDIIKETYDHLFDKIDSKILLAEKPESRILSATLGQLLKTEDGEHTIFQPRVPQIIPKLKRLALWDEYEIESGEIGSDYHEYYVQLRFIPNLSSCPNLDYVPPIELWFDLDESDRAVGTSLRCILHTEDRNVHLQTPDLMYDWQLNVDSSQEIVEPYENNPETWLKDQPGLKEFLLNADLTFGAQRKPFVPNSLSLDLKFCQEGKQRLVNFDYVDIKYRRVLKLKYMDKYLVQLSDVRGESEGAKYTQVDIVGTGVQEIDKFENFIRDVIEIH